MNVNECNVNISKELYTDRFAEQYVLMSVCQQPSPVVSTEDLNLAAVTATAQQEPAVGRDVELTGMGTCGLVPDVGEQSSLTINGKDGYAFSFQAVA